VSHFLTQASPKLPEPQIDCLRQLRLKVVSRTRPCSDMEQTALTFPPVEIATKLLLSLGIGLLVGFEREWSHKDLGVRTFTIVSLFGMLEPPRSCLSG
jgi:hypothetical protein